MSNKMDQDNLDLLKHRKENFRIGIDRLGVPHPKLEEIVLKITHNGYQYTCVSLLPEEIDKLIEVLLEHRNKK